MVLGKNHTEDAWRSGYGSWRHVADLVDLDGPNKVTQGASGDNDDKQKPTKKQGGVEAFEDGLGIPGSVVVLASARRPTRNNNKAAATATMAT